ncbi:MAG: hypothetical protein R3D71_04470 [Rickettsiales bacterium]
MVITIVLCSFSTIVYAGAWTRRSGEILLVSNFSYYFTDRRFDNSGNIQPLADYRKYEFNPYIEYGLYDDVTIGANLFLQRVSQENSVSGNWNSNWGIGDSEFFIRKKIWEKDGLLFSVEPMIKIHSPENRANQPIIGSRDFDTGITLSGGYSFGYAGLNHFVNIDANYRHRLGEANDQINLYSTLGLSINKKTMILTQMFNSFRLSDNKNSQFTNSSGDDYDLTKLQISAMYEVKDNMSLQLGAFSHVSGRNTGGGDGVIFAVHKVF